MDGEQDEITFTTDPAVNFTQLAIRAYQRAQGEKNKALREAWVRLCGTYQSRGGIVANKEVRKVSDFGCSSCVSSHLSASRGGAQSRSESALEALSLAVLVFVNCELSGSCVLLWMDRHNGPRRATSAHAVSQTI